MSVEDKAKQVREELAKLIYDAQNDGSLSEPFSKPVSENTKFIKPQTESNVAKILQAVATGTFIDSIFLDDEKQPIGGLPFGSNSILTGLPNSGKSRQLVEIALRKAQTDKVIYVTSEEAFRTESGRFDLESRMKVDAQKLGLDWSKITENLFVLDTVMSAELREWSAFVSAYRNLVENESVKFALIDSMTLLEDSRGQLKYRVLELMKYNQVHGVTAIFVSQRAIDEPDGLAIAGGIALSHVVDIVFELDYKKLSSWDNQIKQDTGAKQSELCNFFRVLKCRLCKFDAHYFSYIIDENGFVRLTKSCTTS